MMGMSQDSKKSKDKTHVAVHVFITLFGISAWIGTNGIFIQMPVLISVTPESWALPVYLVLVVQAANCGPLLYAILQYFRCKINESLWILCLLASGTIAMGLLSFFYSEKTVIAGTEYSLVLFILTFFNALVGCFSSVLFMPYLRNFNESYLISFFVGEGLSGVLPSIVALVQGVTDDSECSIPKNNTRDSFDFGLNFSPSNYFLFIFIVLFLSLTAFIILDCSSFVEKQKLRKSLDAISGTQKESSLDDSFPDRKYLTKLIRNYYFALLATCCFFGNSVFPSIQSYSCLPYGSMAYKLSITFAQFANPLVCLLAFWLKILNLKIANYLLVICLIIGSYVVYLAIMSPVPPMQTSIIGIILVVISWTILIGVISYLKLVIVSMFRRTVLPKILFNVGVIMQIGSASGAIFSFLIINYTNYFQMHNNCAPLTDN